MLTNLLQILHTTAAYQTAATQLMIGQASFAAQQLGLKEPLPIIVERNTNEWSVSPVPWGVGGTIMTSNYSYGFSKGRLNWISKREWRDRISPPITNLDAWMHQASAIDTNGAYHLATNWLGRLSIDVAKLEKQLPARTAQRRLPVTRTNENNQLIREQVPVPFFDVMWGKDNFSPSGLMSDVMVKIVGTTPELLGLKIRDNSFYQGEPLRVTNAAELLGPLPKPRHFVEKLMGGPKAYETVASPDQVEAWLLNGNAGHSESEAKAARAGPVILKGTAITAFSSALLDFDSYEWTAGKLCAPNYGVRLRFTRANDFVEILLCYECDILQISHNGPVKEENFDFAHNRLRKAIQRVFPRDKAIKNIEVRDERESRAEFEGTMTEYEK